MPISERKTSFVAHKAFIALIIAVLAGASLISFPSLFDFAYASFFASKAKRGTFQDVTDVKEIGLLAVQRIQLSHVEEGRWNEDGSKKEKVRDNDVYVRRIIRGHSTRSLDFTRVKAVVDTDSTIRVSMPPLEEPEPFIDEWIYYDSGYQKDRDPRNLTAAMDDDFKKALVEFAKDGDRPKRAKEQAENIIREMFPGHAVIFSWL